MNLDCFAEGVPCVPEATVVIAGGRHPCTNTCVCRFARFLVGVGFALGGRAADYRPPK